MSWNNEKLADIAEFSNGINFDKNAYGAGIKFIGVSNFGDRFTPDYSSLQEVKYEVVREDDYLQDGDIVFVRSNGNKELVGRCMLIQNAPFPVTYSGFCIKARIKDQLKYDPVFFTYHFKSSMFRHAMSGTAVGANIQNLSQGRMASYMAEIPDNKTQKRIADILRAYDDLIINNQKQIKLLEEAAQRLYKEWFVDLHFPGYEDTKIVDGLPEGWERISVGDILGKVHRTEQIMASDYQKKGKIPIIDQSRNFIAVYTDNDNAIIDLGHPAIVFGDHTRVLKLIQFPFAKGADGTQLIVSSYKKMPERLFYCSLVNVDLSNYHYARHFKYLKAEKIVVPTEKTANEAEAYLEPLFKIVQKCRDIINAAVQSRNCLLPRLMSGEIEV